MMDCSSLVRASFLAIDVSVSEDDLWDVLFDSSVNTSGLTESCFIAACQIHDLEARFTLAMSHSLRESLQLGFRCVTLTSSAWLEPFVWITSTNRRDFCMNFADQSFAWLGEASCVMQVMRFLSAS